MNINLHLYDYLIITGYLVIVAFLGFLVQKKATKGLDSYFLAGRNMPWWMLGLAGCSSYIDIGGTMAMVGVLYYLGLKSIWITHIFWGFFILAFYMAFQAKWIRSSGVMTFAEWNQTRFGDNRDAEYARIASAVFLLVLMIFNLMFLAVGVGKFSEGLFGVERWLATLVVFLAVGLYVTMAGFYGVILTDIFQTLLLVVGAVVLSVMVFQSYQSDVFAATVPDWHSLEITWKLWPDYLQKTPESYHHFEAYGTILSVGFLWMIFRMLAGPNVWDFQFFLTARSPRDAAMAGGMWTVGYSVRWVIACAFLLLGIFNFNAEATFDAEKIMPMVLSSLPVGLRGLFIAVLLAALMSTLDAMINVSSSVVTNDFLKRYYVRKVTEKQLVRIGQIASIIILMTGYLFSLFFDNIVSAWETMIFVVVTMILVPATMRWHWWRFSAKAFVWGMIASAVIIGVQKLVFNDWSVSASIGFCVSGSFMATVIIGFITKPTEMSVLVKFYERIRPFGFWGPVRREAIRQGRVPKRDFMPLMDGLNGIFAMVFQVSLAIIIFAAFLKDWNQVVVWSMISTVTTVILYFTWYKNLPAREEKKR
jgi:Na+/proline symporter